MTEGTPEKRLKKPESENEEPKRATKTVFEDSD